MGLLERFSIYFAEKFRNNMRVNSFLLVGVENFSGRLVLRATKNENYEEAVTFAKEEINSSSSPAASTNSGQWNRV